MLSPFKTTKSLKQRKGGDLCELYCYKLWEHGTHQAWARELDFRYLIKDGICCKLRKNETPSNRAL